MATRILCVIIVISNSFFLYKLINRGIFNRGGFHEVSKRYCFGGILFHSAIAALIVILQFTLIGLPLDTFFAILIGMIMVILGLILFFNGGDASGGDTAHR